MLAGAKEREKIRQSGNQSIRQSSSQAAKQSCGQAVKQSSRQSSRANAALADRPRTARAAAMRPQTVGGVEEALSARAGRIGVSTGQEYRAGEAEVVSEGEGDGDPPASIPRPDSPSKV